MKARFWLVVLLSICLAIAPVTQQHGSIRMGYQPVEAGWKTKVAVIGGGLAAYEFQAIALATMAAVLAANTPQYKAAVASLAKKISAHPFVGPPAFVHGVNKVVGSNEALAPVARQLEADVLLAQKHGEGSARPRAPPAPDAKNPDPDDPKDRCKSGLIDPSIVLFSQDSISASFKNGNSLDIMVGELRSGRLTADQVEPIRLVERDGRLFTLDNRRLKAFQDAGVKVRYRMATEAEAKRDSFKFTTRNGGESIRVRGGQGC